MSCLFILVINEATLSAQSDLEDDRKRIERELKQTSRELKATRSRKGAALSQAGLIKTQISQREELLTMLEEESGRNELRLYRDSTAVASLTADMKGIIAEYTKTLRSANRTRLTDGWLIFLFNADGINDLFRRTIYLRQYRRYRTRQARLITRTKEQINRRLSALNQEKTLQDSLLYATRDQGAILEEELRIQDKIVETLSVSERSLLDKAKQQQDLAAQLKRKIASAIKNDVAKSSRRASSSKRSTGAAASPDDAVGGNIVNRKGRLGWPVQGKITRRFGKQAHPDVPSLTINNEGVDIDGGKQGAIAAVFDGRVIEVTRVGGNRSMVLMNHGSFYTVYSNMEFPQVKSGQEIKTGTQLGLTAENGDALHFELWRGKTALNPESWLTR